PTTASRVYELRFEDATIGVAWEHEHRADGVIRLVRRERVAFRRGAEVMRLDTELELVGADLGAEQVTVTVRDCSPPALSAGPASEPAPSWDQPCAHDAGPRSYRGQASRSGELWRVTDAAGARSLPASAVPAEWLDLVPARRHEPPLQLFFAARGFVLGTAHRRWLGPSRFTGALHLGGAVMETATELAADARPRLTVDSTGLVAVRRAAPPPRRPLADLVALTSLPIAGAAPLRGPRRLALALIAPAAPPAAAPGQQVTAEGRTWHVTLVPSLADPEEGTTAELAALASDIAAEDAPGLAMPRADCTAFALRFAQAAKRRGFTTRIVTGLALDGAMLVRHRWVSVFTGGRWIHVDPSTGEAPAPPRLLALSTHSDSLEDLAAAEVAFTALRGATATWLP
ncbi:MAG: transglutaminase domain-containing protein, partial [Myxococcales bacterium]|nr:transglutaminase domain-containing protein [Myxococcales bacterium]